MLLEDAPSVPKLTQIPFSSNLATGETPDANFILLHGLCEILTSYFLIISISLSESHTACAATTSGPKRPKLSKYSKGLIPVDSTRSSTSF